MSSCNQTPVAILRELCVRMIINERFSLTSSSGTPNDPLFEMCCQTDTGLKATGIGKTKKEAKHNAAKAMLDLMEVPAITQGREVTPPPSVVNPHTEKNLTGNAIGQLQEYCIKNELPNPIYELVGDEGDPHEKTFSFKCEVSRRSELGRGRTKQLAKHNAAQALLENLKKNASLLIRDPAVIPATPQNVTQLTQEELDNVKHIYSLCRPVTNLPTTSPGLKFSCYHKSMKDSVENIKSDLKQSFIAPSKTLEDLVSKLNLTLTYHPGQSIEDVNNGSSDTHHVYAVVNTQPTTVQIGSGSTPDEATMQAALTVLKYWQKFIGYDPQPAC